MKRMEVINKIIDRKNANNYLEIGVFDGSCFRQILAKRKLAVDPVFRFPWEEREITIGKKINRLLFDKFELYFPKTSDAFFQEENNLLKKYPLDVAFIDGLHTYEQTTKDVLNTLNYMNEGGVIIVHDCNPLTEACAHPAASYDDAASMNLPGWDGGWSGDVWKTIATLRATREDISAFVLDTDCGLGIVTKVKSQKINILSETELKKLTYNILESRREEVLGLKPASFLPTFLDTLS